MKLKGLTKLALSGVALAAVAATLGTSTYAWYVSNSTATIDTISGQTASTTSGSLLLNQLSLDGTAAKAVSAWTNTLSYSQLGVKSSTQLDPITKGANGAWKDVTGAEPQSDKFGYLMFGAWVTDGDDTDVNIRFDITNTTTANSGSFTTQVAYNGAGLPTNVNVGTTFTEDFVYALKFDINVVSLTDAGVAVASAIAPATHPTTYAADYEGYTTATGCKSDGNAHDYYRALSSENVTSGAIDGGETVTESAIPDAGVQISLAGNTKYLVVIRYWLDGADEQCFDSCVGQKFSLDLDLDLDRS